MPLLDDIRTYLVTQGLVTAEWPCYEGYFPDDQNQMVSIFETGGMPADTLNRENERVTFQLRVRGPRLSYPVVRAQWLLLFDALQDSQPAPGYTLVQALHYGPMTFNDDRGRPNMISNFRVMKLNE